LGGLGGDGVDNVGKYAVLESSTSLLKVSEIRNVAKDICSLLHQVWESAAAEMLPKIFVLHQVWESAAAEITGRIQLIDWVKFLHILAVSH